MADFALESVRVPIIRTLLLVIGSVRVLIKAIIFYTWSVKVLTKSTVKYFKFLAYGQSKKELSLEATILSQYPSKSAKSQVYHKFDGM